MFAREIVSDRSTRRYGTQLSKGTSTIANAGEGLFTEAAIELGKEICEYFGRRVERSRLINDPVWQPYIFGDKNGNTAICALDGDGTLLSLAGLINDSLEESTWNVDFQWRGSRCFVVATRDIVPGEELFGPYHAGYWYSGRYSLDLTLRARDCYYVNSQKRYWDYIIGHLQAITIDLTAEENGEVQFVQPPPFNHEVIDLTNE